MKRKMSLLIVIVSLVFSAICLKDNRVFALKERACIGDECPQDIVSHNYYTEGVTYVVTKNFIFEYDYYINTYVNYKNGSLTSVNAPVIIHGDYFWAQAAEYNVNIIQDYDYTINSTKTAATVTVTLIFEFTGQIPSYIESEPVIITYTVY